MGQAVSLATFGYVAASQIYHHLMTADSTIDVSGGIVQDPYEVAIDQMYPRFHSRMLIADGTQAGNPQDQPHLTYASAESMLTALKKSKAEDVQRVAVYRHAVNGQGNVEIINPEDYARFYRLSKDELEEFITTLDTGEGFKINRGAIFKKISATDVDPVVWMAVPDIDGSTQHNPISAQNAESIFHEIKTTNVMEVKLDFVFGITSDHANVLCTKLGTDGLNIHRFYILKEEDLMQLMDLMQADAGFKSIPSVGDSSTVVFDKVITTKVENIVNA